MCTKADAIGIVGVFLALALGPFVVYFATNHHCSEVSVWLFVEAIMIVVAGIGMFIYERSFGIHPSPVILYYFFAVFKFIWLVVGCVFFFRSDPGGSCSTPFVVGQVMVIVQVTCVVTVVFSAGLMASWMLFTWCLSRRSSTQYKTIV